METTVDCKQIEQCIKGLLFKNKVTDQPLQNDPSFKTHPYKFSIDDKYLVSNIEEKTQLGVKTADSAFCSLPSKTEKLNNETGVSELIDLNVLTNFAAEHLENTNFSSSDLVLNSNSTRLPHPEHEDHDTPNDIEKKPVISVLLDNISKEIQNSPNFLSMPENPLPETSRSSQNYTISNGFDQSFCKQNDAAQNKKARSKKRKLQKYNAKEKKFHDITLEPSIASQKPVEKPVNPLKPGLLNASNFKTKLEASSKEKTVLNSDDKKSILTTSDQVSDIKVKRSNLTSTGKEYSFSIIQGNYKFQCHLCNHNCEGKSNVLKHLQSRSHRIHKEQNDLDMMLPYLPVPLPEQIQAINDLLLNEISQFGLRNKDLIIRKNVIDKVTKFVEEHVQSCSVEAIGSSATGFGLQSSAVDFTLKLLPDDSVPDALENVFKAIHSDDSFGDVKNDFKKKRPSIHFTDKETRLTCNIEIDNGFSVKLAHLLRLYHDLDERVPILGTAVRFWANLCEIDQQDCGTLPSFAFEILLIHFLQQVNPPVLPVLHEVKGYTSTVEFYKEYKEKKEWVSDNLSSVGELWINFFKFYNFSYKIGEDVISIRSLKRVSCSDKNWSTKFYAIEDPFLKRNLAYVIPTYQVCHYIHDCFLRTYRYFAYPRLKDGCIKLIKADWCNAALLSSFSAKKPLMKEDSTESDMSENEDQLDVSQDLEDHDQDIPFDDVIATVSKLTLDESDMEKTEEDCEFLSVPLADLTTEEEAETFAKEKESKVNEKAVDQTVMCFWDLPKEKVSKESFDYIFKTEYFKGVKSVPLVCRMCKCQGHQKKDCPNDQLPTPCTLPEMTPEFLESVNKALFYIRDKHAVTDTDMKGMTSDMEEIQYYIREVFPDATLSLFGSFCNGFGFKTKSDMDCCLTFGAREDSKDLDCIDIIEKVAKQLRAHPKLENIIPVTSAKVPIVKFTYSHSGLEGDISLYNTLALVNTEMLETYSKIDQRVQILGFALKYFAKTLGICDASRGSLSSYAYILMVIYFLQQRNPPVIPVLQELYNGEKPSKLIEGWNVWFYKDLDKLADVWSDYGKNKESVAELWLGLLSFYACDFDWREYVVSIRQKNLLTRFRKLWLSDQIAIEDPFDLNHNLGAGLSRKMNSYILKAFIRGRERFGTPLSVERMGSILGYEVGYLFDRRFLNSGCEPPHDRGCRNCGKIGHIAKNCSQQKRCSQCNSSDHLYKNCPKKRKGRRSKGPVQNDFHENSSRQMTAENQNSLAGQQKRKKVETAVKNVTSASHGHWNSNEADIQRKMISSGMPVHRLPGPPPGFTSRSYKPPPGFKATINMHQNSYPQPFVQHIQMRSPFSRQEISPPKQYSVSPPKNFPGAKPFPHTSMNMQHGAQIERHPATSDQRHIQTPWRTKGSQIRESFTHQQPNQQQMVEHRPRTRSNILPFSPSYLGDKRQC